MELNKNDIDCLIEIGKIDFPNQNLMTSFKSKDYINRQHGNTWRKLVLEKSDVQIISIYKALIKLEAEFNWIGGSVAGAIWIYKIIQERNLDLNYKLADYGLRNCNNPWIPFGGSYYGLRTISEYFIEKEQKANKKIENSIKYNKKLEREKGRKKRRSKSISDLRKLSDEERENIKIDLLKKYKLKSNFERLQLIANDKIFPPEYYPTEWANVSYEELKELPIDLIKRLYDKLSTKTRGSWRRFSRRLKRIENGK